MRTRFAALFAAFFCPFVPLAHAAPCDGFADVDDGNATYCAAVTYVKDHAITTGCSDASHFCPSDYVTRLQMALFLQRNGRADPSNKLGDHTTAIVGGTNNNVEASAYSTVGGGAFNTALGVHAVVGGGFGNTVANYGVVAGGQNNGAAGSWAAVGGGASNVASGQGATIPGGQVNTASATRSIAMGAHANANQADCLVIALWGTTTDMDCHSLDRSMRFGATNGYTFEYDSQEASGHSLHWVYIGSFTDTKVIDTWTGGYLSSGGNWTNVSDRTVKTDFAPIDPQAVLEKVLDLPITSWRYRNEAAQRHLGPMAQDFHAAFGLGEDDRHITTVDEGGVALAAIQGLNARVEARAASIERLEARNASLERELAAIKALLLTAAAR